MKWQRNLPLWHMVLVVVTMVSTTTATTITTITVRHGTRRFERAANSDLGGMVFGEDDGVDLPEGNMTKDHYGSTTSKLSADNDIEDELLPPTSGSYALTSVEDDPAGVATEVQVVFTAPENQGSLWMGGNTSSRDAYHVLNSTGKFSASHSVNFGDSGVRDDVGTSSTSETPPEELCPSKSSVPCNETLGKLICGTLQDLSCWLSKRNVTPSSIFSLQVRDVQDGVFPLSRVAGMPLRSFDLSDAKLRYFLLESESHLEDEDEDQVVLPHLETLHLSGNPGFELGSLRLLKGSRIKRLHLSRKTVGKLAKGLDVVQIFSHLEFLHLEQNELISLPAESLPKKLEELHMQRNSLVQLELSHELAYSLRVLNASHCYIRSFNLVPKEWQSSGTFRQSSSSRWGQPRLRSFDLSNNELPFLSREVVHLLTNVNINNLRLRNNAWDAHHCSLFHLYNWMKKIGAKDVPRFDFKSLSRCDWDECPTRCSCNPDTRTVDCRNQELLEVPEIGPSDARTLLLDDNNLENLKGIESPVWCKISHISANSNKLSVLIPPGLTGQCRCPGEGFDYEGDHCFSAHLNNISAAGNLIRSLTKGDANFIAHAKRLNIASNALKTLRQRKDSLFFKYLDLIHLDASDNHIKTIQGDDLRHYPYLKFLNLSRNFLNTLSKLPSPFPQTLKVLDVSHNNIFKVPHYESNKSPVFDQNQPNIVKLYINDNRLSNLSILINIAFKSIRTLELNNNPWGCTCNQLNNFRELSRGLDRNSVLLKVLDDMVCATGMYRSKSVRLSLDETERLGTCRKTWRMEQLTLYFFVVIFVLLVIFSVFTLQFARFVHLWQRPSQELPEATRPDTMYIAYHWKESWVWQTLIPSLENMGHQIEYLHQGVRPAYAVGQWRRKISQCNRMLVILTNDFVEDDSYLNILREGYTAQQRHTNFKVLLVMRNMEMLQRLPMDVQQSLGIIGLHENRSDVETITRRLNAPQLGLEINSETTSVGSEVLEWFINEARCQDFLRILQYELASGASSLPPMNRGSTRPCIVSFYQTFHHTSHSRRPALTLHSFQSQDEGSTAGMESGYSQASTVLDTSPLRPVPGNGLPLSCLASPSTSIAPLTAPASPTATISPPLHLQTNHSIVFGEPTSLPTVEVITSRL